MKRTLVLLCVALFACGLSGCGGGIKEGTVNPQTPAPKEEAAESPKSVPAK